MSAENIKAAIDCLVLQLTIFPVFTLMEKDEENMNT